MNQQGCFRTPPTPPRSYLASHLQAREVHVSQEEIPQPADPFIARNRQFRYMEGDTILYSVILLFILCVFVVPPLLYAGLKRLVDPVPLYLLPLLAMVALAVLAGIRELQIISADNVFAGTVVTFLLLLLVVDFAVIAPYPFFEKKLGDASPGMAFVLLAFIGACLLFYMTMGHVYAERPMPLFSGPLPLTGWILDGAVSVLGLGEIVYAFGSPVYELLREAGLYLEVLIIAIAYYSVLSLVPKREPAGT